MYKYLCKPEYVLQEIQISELVSNIGNTICDDDLFLLFLHREDIFTPLSFLPSGNRCFYHIFFGLVLFFLSSRCGVYKERIRIEPGAGADLGQVRSRSRLCGVSLEGCSVWQWPSVTVNPSATPTSARLYFAVGSDERPGQSESNL